MDTRKLPHLYFYILQWPGNSSPVEAWYWNKRSTVWGLIPTDDLMNLIIGSSISSRVIELLSETAMIYRISYRIYAKWISHKSDNRQSHPREIQVFNLDPLNGSKSIVGSDPSWASSGRIDSDTPPLWQRWRTETVLVHNLVVKPSSIYSVK